MSIKIMLADDHALVRTGLRRLLETRGGFCIVGEAANGQEAIELARQCTPDIIFMDISMPLMDGIKATQRIRQQPLAPKIIMLSMHASEDYVRRALDAGAQGYVLKGSVGMDALPAIEAVMAGRHFLSPKLARNMAAAVGLPRTHVESPVPVGVRRASPADSLV